MEDEVYLDKTFKDEEELIIDKLREICSICGDNEWPDNLYMPDILENHILRYLRENHLDKS